MNKSKQLHKSDTAENAVLQDTYLKTLTDLKNKVLEAQIKAAVSVNRELIKLYWEIGKILTDKQETQGWGAKVIETLVKDLQKALPGIEGFSRTNVFRMKLFYSTYKKVAQAVRQLEKLPIFDIPWGHNILLLQKLKDNDERLWYAKKSTEHGWSRNMLEAWVKSDLYQREGKAITNFKTTLPTPLSDLAQQTLKDPYIFDFLTLHKDHAEKDLEQGLIDNVQKFLVELGHGFAFVGRQYHLEVANTDYYIDLLFYHLKLRCYVVVELKNTAFKPEYAGKLNFYLSAIDDQLKHAEDKPTIGMLLCKSKNDLTVEYALRNLQTPIGVSEYETRIVEKLPEEFKGKLPTIKQIEMELEKK